MMVKVYYQCVYQYSEDTDKNPDFIKWMRHAMEDTDAVWSFTDENDNPIEEI